MFLFCSSLRNCLSAADVGRRNTILKRIRARPSSCHRPFSNTPSNTGTYYDSQSGRHVPIHDATKVSAFLLTHTDSATLTGKQLERFAGIRLFNPIDDHQRITLDRMLQQQLGDNSLVCLCDAPPPQAPPIASKSVSRLCLSYTLPLHEASKRSEEGTCSSKFVYNPTAISISAPEYFHEASSPTETANAVASLMDTTAGLGDYILLEPNDVDGKAEQQQQTEAMLQLCEELSYIDMPGPTMNSRLVLSTRTLHADDSLQDFLAMGINKFTVESGQLDWLQSVVEDEGKELV